MMIKAHWMAACLVALTVASAQAAESAGTIKNSRGTVTIERGGQRLEAPVGTPVFVADQLRTGADSAVGIVLRDNTLMSAGPNSTLTIDKFAFDSTTHDGVVSVGVRKGTVSVATGKIAKKTPESVDFHTPTTVLGIRGTEFVVEVLGNKED